MIKSIPCTLIRGGTSKGAYFLESDLPKDKELRDQILLQVMGSPDERQIDGVGGANPLTSKTAIISESKLSNVDIDFLFGQVVVDQPTVGYAQNCGNILAGVGQFAIEKGLVSANDPVTDVSIHMVNSGDIAVATISTPNRKVSYEGNTAIDGVPGTAAAVPLNFLNIAGSLCGSLLPTGNRVDIINGVNLTCIDNGMPVVVIRGSDLGVGGSESIEQLEANENLKKQIENIRLKAGYMMNLGNVKNKTVPKMTLVSAPKNEGIISTRSFIPHRCHSTIGVFAAITVATACLIPDTPAADVSANLKSNGNRYLIEHPSGSMEVEIEIENQDGNIVCKRSGFVRTARKIFEGEVFLK